jgi:hypothetical protein
MTFSRSSLALLTVSLLAAFSPATRAATIIWSSPTNITGDSNVVTAGSLVGAFNLGTAGVPSTTVNGVTFAPFAVPNDLGTSTVTVGNFSIGFRGGRFADNTAFGSSSGAFASLSSSYQTLLRSGVDDSSFNASPRITLTMSGLTIGVVYSFQWWANDSARALDDGATTATSGTSVVVDWNTTNTAGGGGSVCHWHIHG